MLTKQEIRQLGNKEMTEELQKSRRELLKSQFDVRNGTSKEVHMVKNLKRYIAQLQTIAKEMKIEMKPAGMNKMEAAPASEEKAAPAKTAPAAKAKKASAPKKTAAAKSPGKKSAAKSAKK